MGLTPVSRYARGGNPMANGVKCVVCKRRVSMAGKGSRDKFLCSRCSAASRTKTGRMNADKLLSRSARGGSDGKPSGNVKRVRGKARKVRRDERTSTMFDSLGSIGIPATRKSGGYVVEWNRPKNRLPLADVNVPKHELPEWAKGGRLSRLQQELERIERDLKCAVLPRVIAELQDQDRRVRVEYALTQRALLDAGVEA